MSDTDIIFTLRQPFPPYELFYPGYVVKTAVDESVEVDFLNVIHDAFGPPPMTHGDFLLDLNEGWYTREDCLVLYDGATPVAAGQIRVEESDAGLIGYIDTLGVPNAFQKRGFGLEMTKHRIMALINRGVTEIRTEVESSNHPMRSILSQLGFVQQPSPRKEG